MIEVTNLTKRYSNHLAVDHISFKAKKGEVVGLLGPNGAGKTSTMRMLTGFMPPSEGSAQIAGHDVVSDSMEARRSVGYLPERVPVYPDMTVRGYVTFWAKLRRVPNVKASVNAALERVQLMDRQNTLIRHLSKGLRQRLGLAQVLVHNPPVIILDEPTIGIDPQQLIEVRDTVRALGADHTVLFSTHILSEAELVCDRVLIMDKGKIVAQGKPADLRKKLQPGAAIYVEIGGASSAKAREMLKAVSGVESIEVDGKGFVIHARPETDIRAEVSAHVVQAGYTLLEMRAVTSSLESIFLEILGELTMPALIVFRREVGQYLTSPFAYLIAAAVLLLTGVLFNRDLVISMNTKPADPSLVPVVLSFTMIFFAPLLTMRLFAEERREGTLELLLTAPVSDSSIVLGKFLGAWFYFTVLLLLTFLYQIVLSTITAPDMGHAFSAYMGIWLYGGATLAVGMMFSALTESQIIAAFLSMVALMLLWLGDAAGQLIANIDVARIVRTLSLQGHFSTSFATGLLRAEDAAFFAGVIVVMLFITIRIVESNRWR